MLLQPRQDRLGGERGLLAGYAKGPSDGRGRIVIGVLPLKESEVWMCDCLSGPACFVAKVSANATEKAQQRLKKKADELIADRTPKTRASYDAVATTPR